MDKTQGLKVTRRSILNDPGPLRHQRGKQLLHKSSMRTRAA